MASVASQLGSKRSLATEAMRVGASVVHDSRQKLSPSITWLTAMVLVEFRDRGGLSLADEQAVMRAVTDLHRAPASDDYDLEIHRG